MPAPTRAASLEAIVGGLSACQHGAATVHVGGGNHVDVAQVASVAGLASVHVVEHDTFHHNVPQFLQQQGELVPLLKDEMSNPNPNPHPHPHPHLHPNPDPNPNPYLTLTRCRCSRTR